jgi:hypothetical protein
VSCTELTHGLPTGIKGVPCLPTIILWEAGAGEGDQYDLDIFCGSARSVAIGTCHFLHSGWIHPYPVGGGRRHGLDSVDSRPKRDRLITEIKQMKPIMLIGIVLVVLGALALAYQGINYTLTEKVLDLGPIHATKETQKRIPLPPILGGIALISGVALLVAGAKRKAEGSG